MQHFYGVKLELDFDLGIPKMLKFVFHSFCYMFRMTAIQLHIMDKWLDVLQNSELLFSSKTRFSRS